MLGLEEGRAHFVASRLQFAAVAVLQGFGGLAAVFLNAVGFRRGVRLFSAVPAWYLRQPHTAY